MFILYDSYLYWSEINDFLYRLLQFPHCFKLIKASSVCCINIWAPANSATCSICVQAWLKEALCGKIDFRVVRQKDEPRSKLFIFVIFPKYSSYQTQTSTFFNENVEGKRCYGTLFASWLAHRSKVTTIFDSPNLSEVVLNGTWRCSTFLACNEIWVYFIYSPQRASFSDTTSNVQYRKFKLYTDKISYKMDLSWYVNKTNPKF